MKLLDKSLDWLIKISKENVEHQSTLQKWTGTIAMGLSCAAFTGSVLFNKGVPKEQKEFLVSQELVDGTMNVGLFLVLTERGKVMARNAVDKGKIFPEEMHEKIEGIKAKLGKDINLEKILNAGDFSNLEKEKITNYHHGYINAVSIGGSLFAASIVTPIVRNIIASKFQQRNNGEEPVKSPVVQAVLPKEENIYISNKPQQVSVGPPLPRKPLPSTYQSFSSRGGMRV